LTEQQIIEACKQNDRKAQNLLYQKYAPKFFGVCRRYIKNERDAEDVLINGFFKVFSKMEQYSGQGNFEGWMRRIMVTESLMFLRKYNMNLSYEMKEEDAVFDKAPDDSLLESDVMKLLDYLPVGYRTIFNLFAIEGYTHKEIGERLSISINTSKSQLIKARKKLKELLIQHQYNVA